MAQGPSTLSSPAVGTVLDGRATEDVFAVDFEVVIVTYRSRRQVEGLLAGLPDDLPVVLVDNAGNVDGIRELALERPAGRYLDGGGRGFAVAANLGALTSSQEHVVFVNPDSRPTLSALQALVRDVASDPRCASSAAMPVGTDGRAEIGVGGWEPSLGRSVAHAFGVHKLAPDAGLFARPAVGSSPDLDWTTGAVMAVRVALFRELGGFDESFYVYNEDMAFGRLVRERGLHQRLRTDLPVLHAAGGSGAPSREMSRLRGASMARYVDRHRSPSSARGIAVALAIGSVLRAGEALLAGDRTAAAGYVEYVKGVLTARATVGGRLVHTGTRPDHGG